MKQLLKKLGLRIAVLAITLIISSFSSIYSEVRLFDNHVAENQQGDKWFFAEENGLYGVYLNDTCVIPIEYKNIRFENPFFFVEDSEHQEGAYNVAGEIVIPMEKGELKMRGDLSGLIVRTKYEEDVDVEGYYYTIYDYSLKPTHKIKDYIYGCGQEIFKSDESGGLLGAMNEVAEKRLVPIGYGIEDKTGKFILIKSKSYGIRIDRVKLLDKEGIPIPNRKLDNINIALLNNDLKSNNTGFALNIVKNQDNTESKLPYLGPSWFFKFSECEFIYGVHNNFPFFKIIDLNDGGSFTFEKNKIMLEYQGEKLEFIPDKIDPESLKNAIEEANNGNTESLLIEVLKNTSGLGISSFSLNSSMHFKFLWKEFIQNALKYNWKKITIYSTTPSFGLAYFK